MNKDTLIVVQCYQGDQPLVEVMLPKWLHHGCPVLILSPEDSPVTIDHPGVECRSAGLAGWNGEHTIERQLKHLRVIAEYPQKFLFLHDADSVCLSPKLPSYLFEETDNAFFSNDIGDPRICIPPYFFTQGVLQRLLAVSEQAKEPGPAQNPNVGKFIDQYFPSLVRCAGVEHRVYPDGFHQFTQSAGALLTDIYACALMYYEVRVNGKAVLHTIKCKEMLDTVVTGYWEWEAQHSAVHPHNFAGGAEDLARKEGEPL